MFKLTSDVDLETTKLTRNKVLYARQGKNGSTRRTKLEVSHKGTTFLGHYDCL